MMTVVLMLSLLLEMCMNFFYIFMFRLLLIFINLLNLIFLIIIIIKVMIMVLVVVLFSLNMIKVVFLVLRILLRITIIALIIREDIFQWGINLLFLLKAVHKYLFPLLVKWANQIPVLLITQHIFRLFHHLLLLLLFESHQLNLSDVILQSLLF